MAHPNEFVNSLELATNEFPAIAVPELTDNKAQALVSDGSLVSFTAAVKGQQKHDVLNSALLAQLAANKKHDREAEPIEWYEFYSKVMENVGWVLQNLHFTEFHSTSASFEISREVLKFLAEVAGGSALVPLVQSTLESLAKQPGPLQLFGSSSTSSKGGNFQIMPCTVDKSGQVTVAFVAAFFKAANAKTDFLVVSWSSTDIKLHKEGSVVTLNEEVYAQVRKAVLKKLGNNAKKFVRDIDI